MLVALLANVSPEIQALLSDPEMMALLHKAYAKPRAKADDKPKSPKVKAPKLGKAKEANDLSYIVAPPSNPPNYRSARNSASATAESFLLALREAGLRNMPSERTGLISRVVDPSAQHRDETYAIALFQGLTNEAHGVQLDRAISRAQYLTRTSMPETLNEYRSSAEHSARWSCSGYVSGMPDYLGKVFADLEGRERAATFELSTVIHLNDSRQNDAIEYEALMGRLAGKDPPLWGVISERPDMLPVFVACATERLAQVRVDLGGLLSSEGVYDWDAVEMAHKVIASRGAPTFVESLQLLGDMAKSN